MRKEERERKKDLPPGHHLMEVREGLSRTNSWVVSSYVALVSNPRMNVPCPSSVCAYVPMIFSSIASGNHRSICSSVALAISAGCFSTRKRRLEKERRRKRTEEKKEWKWDDSKKLIFCSSKESAFFSLSSSSLLLTDWEDWEMDEDERSWWWDRKRKGWW